jgi:hypothetical protein
MDAREAIVSLPSPAVGALESLWARLGAQYGAPAIERSELRATARTIAAAVRMAELSPERLVIAIKASWASHPELRGGDDRHVPQETLSELVSLCIHEYFASDTPVLQTLAESASNEQQAPPSRP